MNMKLNKGLQGFCLLLSFMCFTSGYSQSMVIIHPQTNGHEYVDLGLSVLWATCNIGADTPDGFGDYFAWGETYPKKEFTAHTYKWNKDGFKTFTKYCYDSEWGADGYTDNLIKLDPDDDAAHVLWGGQWCMPSQMEFEELKLNCTVQLATVNGFNGCRFTSNVEGFKGNSIFIPCPGLKLNGQHFYYGEFGWYWTNDYYNYGVAIGHNNLNPQPTTLNANEAAIFRISKQALEQASTSREAGLPIRPVIRVKVRDIVVPENIKSKSQMGGTLDQPMGGGMRSTVEP